MTSASPNHEATGPRVRLQAGPDQTSTPSLIVEFMGFPGAGKTTLASQLTSTLISAGYSTATRADLKKDLFTSYIGHTRTQRLKRLSYLIRSAWLYPEVVFPALELSRALRVGFGRTFAGDRLIVTLILYGLLNRHAIRWPNTDIVILEEALLHRIWCSLIEMPAPPDKVIQRMIACGLRHSPTLVVFVDADVETAAERITQRTSRLSNFDTMKPEEILTHLRKAESALLKIASITQCLGIPVIRLCAHDTPEYNIHRLTEYICGMQTATNLNSGTSNSS